MEIDSRRIGCQKVAKVAWLRGGGGLGWAHPEANEAYASESLYLLRPFPSPSPFLLQKVHVHTYF